VDASRGTPEPPWRDPTAPGPFDRQSTAPAQPPPAPQPAWSIPDLGQHDPERRLGGPARPEVRLEPTTGLASTTGRPTPPRATPLSGTVNPAEPQERSWAGVNLPFRMRSREQDDGPIWFGVAWLFELLAVLILILVVLTVYALFSRTRIPEQVRFTVNAYYYSVEDRENIEGISGYICTDQRTAWRAAQSSPASDTRRGITSHHIDSADKTVDGWRVRVTAWLVEGGKTHATLLLVPVKGGAYLICGGTDQP
jgi:hypothetical protein